MRVLFSLAIVVCLALAGCSGGDGDTTTTTTRPPGTTATATSTGGGTTTELRFSASPTDGDATLAVSFAATVNDRDANGRPRDHDDPFTWTLMFGDGTDTDGDEAVFPLEVSHEYATAGSFTARITITLDDDETLTQAVTITVRAGGASGDPPQLVFEFGPSIGCAGDVLQAGGADCPTAVLGPGSTGPDGFWVPLDERYWGLSMVATADVPNVLGDTDGFFVRDDGTKMNADVNNGAGPAQGSVPDSAAWLFVYSYALPSQSMTVTFA